MVGPLFLNTYPMHWHRIERIKNEFIVPRDEPKRNTRTDNGFINRSLPRKKRRSNPFQLLVPQGVGGCMQKLGPVFPVRYLLCLPWSLYTCTAAYWALIHYSQRILPRVRVLFNYGDEGKRYTGCIKKVHPFQLFPIVSI